MSTGRRGTGMDVEMVGGGRPAIVNARARDAVRRSRRVSHVLDEAVRVPGTDYRVGADPILGLLPGGGDAVALLLSLYPVLEGVRFGASRWTLARMLANVTLDAVVGSVPILGTLFDAVWKANERNVSLLERDLLGAR